MRHLIRHGALVLVLGAIALGSARAASAGDTPVVVELFTSQGCYSCPPAEKLLGELSQDPGLIALEFHVDYWDTLVYGAAGSWKDPFSDPAHTERQRLYNRAIRGSRRVYTPQMVVDGRSEMIGSHGGVVREAIASARGVPSSVHVEATGGDGDQVRLNLSSERGESAPAGIWLVRFLREQVTEVPRGENKGKTLTNHHIVTGMTRLGAFNGAPLETTVETGLSEGEGCAILVQAEPIGAVLGAAYCPSASS